MNPFNNRWVALFSVLGLLLVVAELVGTGEHGGVLSQAARSSAATSDGTSEGVAEAPPPEAMAEEPRVVIEEVPEDDMPQAVSEDDVDDTGDYSTADDAPDLESDEPAEDYSNDD